MGKFSQIFSLLIAWLVCATSMAAETRVLGYAPTPFLRALNQPQRTPTPEQVIAISELELERLLSTPIGEAVQLQSLNLGLAKSTQLDFRRVRLHAPGSRVLVSSNTGVRELKRAGRLFFLAADATSSVGFAIDRETRNIQGILRDQGATFVLTGFYQNGGLNLEVVAAEKLDADASFRCELDNSHQTAKSSAASLFPSLLAIEPTGSPIFDTTIAVDTDNEWLFHKFGNNASAAQTWLDDLFLAFNVIFEADLQLHITQGDVMLRIDTTPAGTPDFNEDPYTAFSNGLGELGDVWRLTPALLAIDRDFVMMFSAKGFAQDAIISANSFSGVAWVNAYCLKGGTNIFQPEFGSFSFNRVGANLSPSFTSGGVGHELGHNLGSSHTHCEQLRNGNTEFVDICYSCEDNDGVTCDASSCYVGATACPAGGVGSLMSYCHAPDTGFDGPGPAVGPPGSCDNSDDFDPLIITKLSGLIASNSPSCIAAFASGNNAPVAADECYSANAGVSLVIAAPGVLGNDSDADMNALTAVLVNGPDNSQSFVLNSNGSFSYQSNSSFLGTDRFTYRANDGLDDSNLATVTLYVHGDIYGDGFEGPCSN